MNRAIFLLILAPLGLAAGAPAAEDPAAWVAAQGGTLTRDKAGHVAGVSLRGTWITDTDLDIFGRMPYLRSLDLS